MWCVETEEGVLEHFKLDLTRASSVSECLIGSKQIRHGSMPSPDNTRHIQTVVNACISKGQPITLLVMWGAVKAYADRAVDLVDLMALHRLHMVNEHVKTLYPPGIHVKLIWEDFTETVMVGTPSIAYTDSFKRLLAHLNLSFIELILESTLTPGPNYIRDIVQFAGAIEAGCAADVGWRGDVPWEYYMERSKSQFPDHEDTFRRSVLSTYFGICLARYKHNVLPNHTLKCSFCPYLPEVPDSMRVGRLEYKTKTGKSCKCTTPPWAGLGVLTKGSVDIIGVRVFRERTYVQIPVRVEGHTIHALRLQE